MLSVFHVIFVQYTLLVKADDGNVHDMAKVEIKIENVNDNPPVFLPYNKNITIQEEEIVPGCIVTVSVVVASSAIFIFIVRKSLEVVFLNVCYSFICATN
jgi:hypothetical protein